jgi:hypothetical protein
VVGLVDVDILTRRTQITYRTRNQERGRESEGKYKNGGRVKKREGESRESWGSNYVVQSW